MLVMVQLETAQRLAAGPGDAAFGLPSLKLRYRAVAEIVGRVSPEVFAPRPRVESALLAVGRRDRPLVSGDASALFDLARVAFGQRRKMLRRSLAPLVSAGAFVEADVDPTARPGELDVTDWARLVEAVAA
jgi:16S rRNA (adenine1518-N6/adenine1519-N6)-dimethyltransferase